MIVRVQEGKRHPFQDGDYIKFSEVEGMVEANSLEPTLITSIDKESFKVHVDATQFSSYTRNGIAENVKVPQKVSFHGLKQSIHNPIASSKFGMLETPDLRFFGRSD